LENHSTKGTFGQIKIEFMKKLRAD